MLELQNISVAFEDASGEVEVVSDVSLTLEKKKIYVMTGPNGGGKSSLAKAIMGIYPPSSGRIILDGVDITHMSITERAKLGVGYAFQSPARFKGLTVRDFLKLAAGPDSTVADCDLLIDVGLCAQDYLDREINASFSGGELKRIEIASVLARDLKVALFDEPEAGIDLWSFQRLTETFRTLNDRHDTTIVIISHQERILRLADEVILVADGKIQEITTRDKVLDSIGQFDTDCLCPAGCGREAVRNAQCSR